eukprot:CAMPEP_0197521912 /NCGR_PEP_ID=MMETSP1318-20131121/7124_1 /TAXON_ID=552666 /ORGANISM="Partenskyella glossopodia, Strain RCC365" /LENGTH=97 /DNA_ID=CAMNT_0043074075 /DNA_START=1200 /DNA_END=1493 /DNA_ORIENTATION=+
MAVVTDSLGFAGAGDAMAAAEDQNRFVQCTRDTAPAPGRGTADSGLLPPHHARGHTDAQGQDSERVAVVLAANFPQELARKPQRIWAAAAGGIQGSP